MIVCLLCQCEVKQILEAFLNRLNCRKLSDGWHFIIRKICIFLLTRLSLSILLLLQSLTVMHCNLTRLNCLGLSDRFSFVWREQERNANQFYVDQFSEIDFYWTVFVVYTFYNNKKFVLNWEIFSFIYFYFGNTLSAFILFESS